MLVSEIVLRMLAYSKASLLRSLEGLSQEELVWQPAKGKNSIGWNAGHVGQFQSALMWNFDAEPDWDLIAPFLPFGYGSNPDEVGANIPPKAELMQNIHTDWTRFLERFDTFSEGDFEREVPLNNPDGETLFEMLHRVSWHVDYHVGRICAIRSMLNKPAFPRPMFGGRARRALKGGSESGWEKIIASVDRAIPSP